MGHVMEPIFMEPITLSFVFFVLHDQLSFKMLGTPNTPTPQNRLYSRSLATENTYLGAEG